MEINFRNFFSDIWREVIFANRALPRISWKLTLRTQPLQRFSGNEFRICLTEHFFTTLVYDVENDLSKNEYLIDDRISCGPKKI